MKHLLLVRHAKSSWKSDASCDFDRPLNKRGRHNLPGIAGRIHQGLAPISGKRCLYFSPALRTRLTANAIAVHLNISKEQQIPVPELYEVSVETYLETIKNTPDTIDLVIMVAHNPALLETLESLSHETMEFPTGAASLLRLPTNTWHQLNMDAATLVWTDTPKSPFFV